MWCIGEGRDPGPDALFPVSQQFLQLAIPNLRRRHGNSLLSTGGENAFQGESGSEGDVGADAGPSGASEGMKQLIDRSE